jgi:hypothetical protein
LQNQSFTAINTMGMTMRIPAKIERPETVAPIPVSESKPFSQRVAVKPDFMRRLCNAASMWFVVGWTGLCGLGLLDALCSDSKPKLTQWEAVQAELQRIMDAGEGRKVDKSGEWLIAAGIKVTGWFYIWLMLGVPMTAVNFVTRKTG